MDVDIYLFIHSFVDMAGLVLHSVHDMSLLYCNVCCRLIQLSGCVVCPCVCVSVLSLMWSSPSVYCVLLCLKAMGDCDCAGGVLQ